MSGNLRSQSTKDAAVVLGLDYGFQLPAGDLSDRFGTSFKVGGHLSFLPESSSWQYKLNGAFFFGNNVKEDVLSLLRTNEGFIIGNDRSPADIQLRQRGIYLGLGVARVFPFSEQDPRTGFLVELSGGFLQHRIRIQDDPQRSVPALLDDFKKGYDRLSNGLYSSQFLGYQQMSGKVNFYIGIEAVQAFTQNRRNFNYDTQMLDDQQRLDIMLGLKVGWILPFFLGDGSDIYY